MPPIAFGSVISAVAFKPETVTCCAPKSALIAALMIALTTCLPWFVLLVSVNPDTDTLLAARFASISPTKEIYAASNGKLVLLAVVLNFISFN